MKHLSNLRKYSTETVLVVVNESIEISPKLMPSGMKIIDQLLRQKSYIKRKVP